MSWFQENKFLAGFLIVTAVGAGALGFLAMSAQSKFAESEERYDQLAGDLSRLQGQAPFPSDPNVRKMDELRKAHEAAIVALQADLSKAEIPVEPISPGGFQDLLKASVDEVRGKAAANGVELPPTFYLGYAKYESSPPKDAAAAPLARMLKSVKIAVLQLIQERVASITSVDPEPLPEEKDGAPAGDDSEKKGKKGGSDGSLVERYPFTVVFVGKERAFHSFVNQIVTNKQQFMIPKTIKIANEKTTGPQRGVSNAPIFIPDDPGLPPDGTVPPPDGAIPPAPDAPADPNAPAAPPAPGVPVNAPPAPGRAPAEKALTPVVGEEKLLVNMTIEVVNFTEPPAAGENGKSKKAE